MSGRVRQRERRIPPQVLNEWKAEVFLAKGWKSKVPEQTQMRDEMVRQVGAIESSVLKPDVGKNCFSAIDKEDLSPGKEFAAFKRALAYFERAPPKDRVRLAEDLERTARAYLDHAARDYSKRQQRQKQNIRKKEICEAALADLRKFDLRDQVVELGDPPWNSETGMKAASLKATLDIETVPPGTKGSETLGGVHEFPAFWVNKPGEGGEAGKGFLFKPTTNIGMNGFPAGGESAREVGAARLGDLLNGMTGLNVGVPETNLVSIGTDLLPEGPMGEGVLPPDGGKLTGSLQTFATTDGELRAMPLADMQGVSPESCQKIMVLDMIMLNCDRHGGNLLVKRDGEGPPDLVPIDHGQSFPPATPGGFTEVQKAMGSTQSALLRLPGSHEPFTPEMIEAIGKLDPDAMAEAMRSEMRTLARAHPQTAGKIDDASIEMTRRSAMFLKRAAAADPAPTPAAAQVALAQNAPALFDPALSDEAFIELADELVRSAAANAEGVRTFCLLPLDEQERIKETLNRNGWPRARGGIDVKWLMENADQAIKLAQSGTMNPIMYDELKNAMGEEELKQRLKQFPLTQIHTQWFVDPKNRPGATGGEADEVREMLLTFTATKVAMDFPAQVLQAAQRWREFKQLGGARALGEAIKTLGLVGTPATNARTLLIDGLNAVRNARALAMSDEHAPDKEAADLAMVESQLGYLRRVAAELPDDDGLLEAIEDAQNAPVTGTREQIDELRMLTLRAIDGVRKAWDAALERAFEVVSQDPELLTDEQKQSVDRDLPQIKGLLVNLRTGIVEGVRRRAETYGALYP